MDIRTVDLDQVWTLRQLVMWPDKSVEFVKLADDAQGLHLGLHIDERLVSVVSLFMEGSRAQFRKFATLPEEQGKGYGSALLAHTIEEAKRRGAHVIWCNARKHKLGFYKKFELAETDACFEKEGIEYVILEKTIS